MSSAQQHLYLSLVERVIASLLVVCLFTVLDIHQTLGAETAKIGSPVTGQIINQQPFPESDIRKPIRTMWVVATAYSSDVAQTDDTPCIPASGFDLCHHYDTYKIQNTIAANFLRLGTIVRIPELYGDKELTVHDRMNSRYDGTNRIDIWMPTRAEAVRFGVQYLKMEIY